MQLGTAYIANRIVRHVQKDMAKLRRLGFDFVVHTFSEFDLQFQQGNIQKIVAVTHQAGLKAYLDPWGVGNVFGGEAYSDFVTVHFQDACQVLDNGEQVFLACPNAPAFKAYMDFWTDAALESGADGVFWDEPHFNHPDYLKGRADHWACRCPHCQQQYANLYNRPMPTIEDSTVLAFKRSSIIHFLEKLTIKVHQAGKTNILYLPANIPVVVAREDWTPYAQLSSLDILSTGLYWTMAQQPVQMVADYALIINKLAQCYQKDHWYWIQNLRIPAGQEKEIQIAMDLCYQNGIRNFALWCFEGGEPESWAACERPQLAWRTAIATYKTLKAQENL